MKRILLISMVGFLVFSCSKENRFDCFTSNGPESTEVRFPGHFSSILIHDKFEVEIIQGNEYKVEVSCGEHILHNIISRVSNDTLVLENKNRCNFVRGYNRAIRFKISVPNFVYLENEGVGVVTINEAYKQDSISVRVSNSGDIHVNGKYRVIKTSSNGNGDMYIVGQTTDLYVYTNGINYVYAENISVSNYMFIHTATIGDCRVNASGTKKFDYNIQNTGNIYYIGDPLEMGNFSSAEAKGKIIKE